MFLVNKAVAPLIFGYTAGATLRFLFFSCTSHNIIVNFLAAKKIELIKKNCIMIITQRVSISI